MSTPSPSRTARATMPRMRNGRRFLGGAAAVSPAGGRAWGLCCLTTLSMTSHLQMEFGFVASLGASIDLEKEEQGQDAEEADSAQQEDLLEGEDQRLPRDGAHESGGSGLRRTRRIETPRRQGLRDLPHPFRGLDRPGRDVRREGGL